VALQIEYSLAQRTVERDLIPMAAELGLGVIPWSPLASGVLVGKYTEADLDHDGGASAEGTRKDVAAGNGSLTARNLAIADVVKDIATQIGATPAQVALAWTLDNPAVTSPIIGARTLRQFEDNVGALDIELDDSHLATLEKASAVELGFPHDFLTMPLPRSVIFGDLSVQSRR
jgi:aryl-alcohol dehydrogenase-like predicted oxidoreductase